MTLSHFPFGYWPFRHLPGWHWANLSCGYRAYRGAGGLANVDFSAPVGIAQPDAGSVALTGLGHEANARCTYALRPVAGNGWLETPDVSCICELETDSGGEWVGNRPAAVEWVDAAALSGGRVKVSWAYRTPGGQVVPADFAVYCRTSPHIIPGEPDATKPYASDGAYSHTFERSDGVTYWLAVAARTAAGLESPLSRIIGPVLADATPPAAPVVTISTTFSAR